MSTHEIRSPLPGTFYRKPSPDAPSFKNDGDAVAEGDVIGLIEVMKTFHEVHADASGAGLVFVAEDNEPIMAGQVIAEVQA
ncbi:MULTISPECIES: acetyl-CoA carboxylase [Rhizobium/Agrobacterium group]|uniref:acetyl-CoA carboxylase n=1 Tax=Rhizobium/Agrobacterium group TaxID=227290 RepID=UPI000B3FE8B6|nr:MULTISPECIES: acetyl-CoA carboxylase [Rhizobium/Agrobacterium group]MCF1481413.1 biotin carboxyl carrier domain-containing protein [Allorhizobium ampelinum]MVA74170.1 biotin carboxyl carrier domain-containing protein [Agrobacterium vitis]NSZ45264.1 biotin carboxyl carrier domain-containing protein [Agrobacterium vitis]NTA29011.1 biotin carboxyl carrier domain-containing protein [Allorhizobium ampelinum]OVE90947.1 acetyl-CoA carboxylase biotin carboxyl carrier protein subunit [Allorhizobium 